MVVWRFSYESVGCLSVYRLVFTTTSPLGRMQNFVVGNCRVDILGNRVERDGDGVHLEPKVMKLLCFLVEHPGEVVTRETLLDHVWAGQVVEDDALSAAVIKLRKALGDRARHPSYIETVPKRGYRLIANVEPLDATRNPGGTIASEQTRPGIAVLPFENLSDEPEQRYFADGMSEDIISALSRARTFRVSARGSSFTYRDSQVDIRTVASELGVRYVLEGSVRKNGDRVRVTVRLVDVESDAQIWAERFDRVITDVFKVQDEITDLVVGALEPELGYAERSQIRSRTTESLSAWEHYQRGLDHMYQRTVEHDALAEEEFQRAMNLDAGFPAPLAALAYTLAQNIYQSPPDEVYRARTTEAIKVATQAIALDPGNALAHCALGRALSNSRQFDRALDPSRKAVELNPSSATCTRNLGFVLLHSGDAESAVSQLKRALQLSPRDPETWSFCHGIAMSYLALRNFELALVWVERALVAPNPTPWTQLTRAAVLGWLGRLEEAHGALKSASEQIENLSIQFSHSILSRQSRSPSVEVIVEGLRRAGLREA